MLLIWGIAVRWLLQGLSRLPDFDSASTDNTVFRGLPEKQTVLKEYVRGRPIQWGAFTSTSSSWDTAKKFAGANPADSVIVKITGAQGKLLGKLSFFPMEHEVLLSPSSQFVVAKEATEIDGFTVVELVMIKGKPFVF